MPERRDPVTRGWLVKTAQRLLGAIFAEHAAHELAGEDVYVLTFPAMMIEMNLDDWKALARRAPRAMVEPVALRAVVDDAIAAATREWRGRIRVDDARFRELVRTFDERLDRNALVDPGERSYAAWREALLPTPQAPPADVATPDDRRLAHAIDALAPEDRTTREKHIVGHAPTLRDLRPLTRLPALRELSFLGAPTLADLGPLAELPSLEDLSLSGCNALTDLAQLASLPALRHLGLSQIGASSLEALGVLSRLEALDVDGDLRASTLRGMTGLERLRLSSHATLDDWQVLAELPALRELTIAVRDAAQLPHLSRLVGLRALTLADESVAPTLDFLAPLALLESFTLTSADIADVSALARLEQLRKLDLSMCTLPDVSVIGRLRRLEKLDLSWVEGVRDLSFVAELGSLERLDVMGTKIDSLEGVERLSSLTSLGAGMTRVEDLRPVASLRALTELDLREIEELTDLRPLEGLPVLERLTILDTRVRDLTPLTRLPALRFLDISATPVRDLGPLAECAALEHLDGERLPIVDVAPLGGLGELRSVELRYCERLRSIRALASCPKLATLDVEGCTRLRGPRTLAELREGKPDAPPDFAPMFARLPMSRDRATGLVAAIVSGPRTLPWETWIPELRHAELPRDVDAAADQLALILKFSAHVLRTLAASPTALCPPPDDEKRTAELCAGYMQGARLYPNWEKSRDTARLLLPIAVLSGELGDESLPGEDGERLDPAEWRRRERERLPDRLADLFRDSAWRSLLKQGGAASKPKPSVGRNDPCPCGSGKKYKKCCL